MSRQPADARLIISRQHIIWWQASPVPKRADDRQSHGFQAIARLLKSSRAQLTTQNTGKSDSTSAATLAQLTICLRSGAKPQPSPAQARLITHHGMLSIRHDPMSAKAFSCITLRAGRANGCPDTQTADSKSGA